MAVISIPANDGNSGLPALLLSLFFQSFSCVNRDQSVRPALFVDGRCGTVSKHDGRLGRRVMGQRVGKELFALLPSCLLFQHLAADECALSGLRPMLPDVHVGFDVHSQQFIFGFMNTVRTVEIVYLFQTHTHAELLRINVMHMWKINATGQTH